MERTMNSSISRVETRLNECCQNLNCSKTEFDNLTKIIPTFSNWISNKSYSLCEDQSQTCEICSNATISVIEKMEKENILQHQTSFLTDMLCIDWESYPECQEFLDTTWPLLAECLTDEAWMSNLSCIYFGDCLSTDQYSISCPQVNSQ